MDNAVEYNKIAIIDVRSTLSQIVSAEPIVISLDTVNLGDMLSKFTEIVKLYNSIEEETLSIVKTVDKMLEDVLSAVDEVESS